VAFVYHYDYPSTEIGLAASDGSCVQHLTNNDAADGWVETCHEPMGLFCPSLGTGGLSWSSDSERILFTSDRDGDADVYVMNRDGSNVEQLTDNSADDIVGDKAWSPTGESIVFTTDRDGNPEIYSMNPDGKEQTNLSRNEARDVYPQWSPDGSHILFSSTRASPERVYDSVVMNRDGSSVSLVTDGPDEVGAASWSSKSDAIAYVSFCCGDNIIREEIFLVSLDGSGRKLFVADIAGNPEWSPKGETIGYYGCPNRACDADHPAGIHLRSVDGTSDKQITYTPYPGQLFKWSPDGARLAYDALSTNDDKVHLFVINADGSNPREISDRLSSNPVWSPR
jgi:TolB protein